MWSRSSGRGDQPRIAVLAALACVLGGCPGPAARPPIEPPPPIDEPEPPPPEPVPEVPAREAGVVKLGPVMMTGGIGMSAPGREEAKRAFIALFDANVGPFRRCYASALDRNPTLAGSHDVEVVIARDGSLYELRPGAVELDDAELVRCAERALRELRHGPLPDGEYFSITVVLQFKPD